MSTVTDGNDIFLPRKRSRDESSVAGPSKQHRMSDPSRTVKDDALDELEQQLEQKRSQRAALDKVMHEYEARKKADHEADKILDDATKKLDDATKNKRKAKLSLSEYTDQHALDIGNYKRVVREHEEVKTAMSSVLLQRIDSYWGKLSPEDKVKVRNRED